jgi:hypothetical protein
MRWLSYLLLFPLLFGCPGESATDGAIPDRYPVEGLRFPDSQVPEAGWPDGPLSDGSTSDIYANPDDWDNDGLANDREQLLGTDPKNADTDNDGTDDKQEVGDPQNPTDSDGDGKIDAIEPDNFDSDKDGTNDSQDKNDTDGKCGNVQRLFLFATLKQDTTLSKGCSPYKVLGALRVVDGAELVVSPDVTVVFGPHATLFLGDNTTKGSLALSGNKDLSGVVHPVLLTADTKQPVKGYWRGIVAENANSVTLSYTTVQYGGDVTGSADPKALILVKAADSIAVNASTLSKGNGYGLHAAIKNSAGKLFLGFQGNSFKGLDQAAALNIRHLTEIEKDNDFQGLEVRVSEGTVDQDGTWRDIQAPYVFEEQSIAIDAKLSIQDGVTLILPGNAAVYVGYNGSGELNANGSGSAPITFKTQGAAAGTWQGILLTTGSNILDNVTILGAGGQGSKSVNAALYVESSAKLSPNNINVINSAGYGVYLNRTSDSCKDVKIDEYLPSGSAKCGLFCLDDTNSPGKCLKP